MCETSPAKWGRGGGETTDRQTRRCQPLQSSFMVSADKKHDRDELDPVIDGKIRPATVVFQQSCYFVTHPVRLISATSNLINLAIWQQYANHGFSSPAAD